MKLSRRNLMKRGWGLTVAVPSLWLSKTGGIYAMKGTETQIESRERLEGVNKYDLPTPALLLDLDRLESNIAKMSRHARESSIHLRPHAKTHKCPEIARRQIEVGALGVCTATIHEAEAMAAADITGLLITSEVVGRNKIERLVRLTRKQPDTMSVVDNARQVQDLSDAAQAKKVNLNVLIDIDPGGRRTGVAAGNPAVDLAEKILKLPNLTLRGVHSYSGGSSHIEGFEARKAHSFEAMKAPLETCFRMKKAGMPIEIISGSSTGTYNIDVDLEGMTEMQVGSYVFMDVDYRRIGGKSGPVYEDFAPSLTVLATVISKNHSDRATIDAGFKAVASDRDFGPELKNIRGVEYEFNGDEHGALIFHEPSREIKLGDRVELIVPHCDPNVNLYDRVFCVRNDRVEEVWPIAARGYS